MQRRLLQHLHVKVLPLDLSSGPYEAKLPLSSQIKYTDLVYRDFKTEPVIPRINMRDTFANFSLSDWHHLYLGRGGV